MGEQELNELIRAQDGVIGRHQVEGSLAESRLRSGRWIQVHKGVYRPADTTLSTVAVIRAAAMATRGVASHLSAAYLHCLRDSAPRVPQISRCSGAHTSQAIRLFRPRNLNRNEITALRGIVMTRPARTIIDSAALIPRAELEDLIDLAIRKGLINAERMLGKSNTKTLKEIFSDRTERGAFESPVERKVSAALREAGLPEPARQYQIGPYRADFAYPDSKVIIEVDGMAAHSGSRRYAKDIRRSADLNQWGWTIVRVTSEILERHKTEFVMRVAIALDLFPTRFVVR